MKILILYRFSGHVDIITHLIKEMSAKGLQIAALNTANFSYQGNYLPNNFFYNVVALVMRIPKIRGLVRIMFGDILIRNLSRWFEIIDFHSFTSDYGKLVLNLKEDKKSIIVTYYGSDILRANRSEKNAQFEVLKNVDQIRAISPAIKVIFENTELENLLQSCYLGNKNIDQIYEVAKSESKETYFKHLNTELRKKVFEKDVVVVVGNNGTKNQQHLSIINELSNIASKIKEYNCLFIFPITYGLTNSYRDKLESKLEKAGLSYILLEDYLPQEEHISLIVLSDLFITMQTSDAFSFYVQEQIVAGTIVLYGEWLPYGALEEEGILLHKTSFETLAQDLLSILSEFNQTKLEVENLNPSIMKTIFSWDYVSDAWKQSYNSL